MMWLELRKHDYKYNDGWNFTESVWAPTKKENGQKWPFWYLVNNVIKGDIIFHLKEIQNEKVFAGYSIAKTDGYITNNLPTDKEHLWDFSKDFFKVKLKDFKSFDPVVKLSDFFEKNNSILREKFKNKEEKKLFYVIQNNKLQCLNGAYFSEFDDVFSLLLTKDYETVQRHKTVNNNAITGITYKELAQRVGQQVFSENVKKNYGFKCCFPNCEVEGKDFLVGGHIARWADNESLRGNTENGLCFCLMHDKAFEKGYFTLEEDFTVVITSSEINKRHWLKNILEQGKNLEIKPREINPSIEALKEHWNRIGYKN